MKLGTGRFSFSFYFILFIFFLFFWLVCSFWLELFCFYSIFLSCIKLIFMTLFRLELIQISARIHLYLCKNKNIILPKYFKTIFTIFHNINNSKSNLYLPSICFIEKMIKSFSFIFSSKEKSRCLSIINKSYSHRPYSSETMSQ